MSQRLQAITATKALEARTQMPRSTWKELWAKIVLFVYDDQNRVLHLGIERAGDLWHEKFMELATPAFCTEYFGNHTEHKWRYGIPGPDCQDWMIHAFLVEAIELVVKLSNQTLAPPDKDSTAATTKRPHSFQTPEVGRIHQTSSAQPAIGNSYMNANSSFKDVTPTVKKQKVSGPDFKASGVGVGNMPTQIAEPRLPTEPTSLATEPRVSITEPRLPILAPRQPRIGFTDSVPYDSMSYTTPWANRPSAPSYLAGHYSHLYMQARALSLDDVEEYIEFSAAAAQPGEEQLRVAPELLYLNTLNLSNLIQFLGRYLGVGNNDRFKSVYFKRAGGGDFWIFNDRDDAEEVWMAARREMKDTNGVYEVGVCIVRGHG